MRYLVWFGHNNSYFTQRFRELESVSRMMGVDQDILYSGARPTGESTDPYAIVNFPNDEVAAKICQQSVLAKFVIELWGAGGTDEDVISSIRHAVSPDRWKGHLEGEKSFSYKVIGYGIQHTEASRRDRMMAFSSLFTGLEKVDLRNPTTTLYIIDEHERIFEQTGSRNELIQADKKATFYGRLVSLNDPFSRNQYVLTERPVLGPTSLDNDLAFIMANMAEIKAGSYVFDPFCGTGGLLIASTANGGIPQIGTDIDIRVISGQFVAYIRNRVDEHMGTDIFQNFKHYKLAIPEIVATDNSHPCWRVTKPLFDSILTDPPYGVRAGAKKIGSKFDHDIGNRDDYYPQMVGYQPHEVNSDLLELASTLLVDYGTLVFLLHIELMDLFTQDELGRLPRGGTSKCTKVCTQPSGRVYVYANECARDKNFLDENLIRDRVVPKHANMKFESAVLQILSAGTGRVLVKMRRLPRS
jgi:tRNA (guanine10-N2)-methyltransferase